ncbi:2'-5' RNA ligase superfamily protein [Novosphingobium sp. PhB165]|uniref:2'-5' RNA ligase family protein n=1 Tax=Novosphingobium sp. PhB165 TaxID=2485105 RepID=UPI0010E330C6|nr:2'-5' RNA ligase family protein [Novosphingobium sp. PhB165]TCM16115.1 2'-5' RNA ligase superfamily protein [Novosphingobium sp. PhB165]
MMPRYFIPALAFIPTLAATMAVALPARAQDAVSIDIYAIPSRPVVEAVAAASKDLAKRGMTTFYAQGHAVHATLYLTQYPASAEPQLEAAIAKVVKDYKSFPLILDGKERTASNWLFLRVKWSPALQRLADLVTLAAEPYRDHNVSPPGWMSQYPAKLPAFERYGSPNVFMQFDPHLTLLANETNPGLAAFMAETDKTQPQTVGEVEGVGIGLVDTNGQVVKTLAEFRFSGHA